MESQINNNPVPMDEVDEFRQQIAQFKQRLDQQEIINDRLMRHTMNARISICTKTNITADAIVLFIMSLAFWIFNRVGISWHVSLFVLLMLIGELTYNVIGHRKLQRLFTDDNDLLTVRRGLLKFKRSNRIQLLITVPLNLLWVLAIFWQLGVFAHTQELILMSIAVFIGLFIGFAQFAWEMHRINNSIREIDDLATE